MPAVERGRMTRLYGREQTMKIALTAFVCALGLVGMVAQAADAPMAKTDYHKQPSICLNAGDIDSLSYPDDNTILFHMRGGKVRIWRNDLPRACNGLKFEAGIAWEIRGGEICSNMQTFYVLRRWAPCMLGNFTPYTPPGGNMMGPDHH
jgi:hypothetical protein